MKPIHRSNSNDSQNSTNVSRRDALRAGAALTVATIVPRHVLGGDAHVAPSEKTTLAGVGIGGVGHGQLQGCQAAGFNIVALCDVDDLYAKELESLKTNGKKTKEKAAKVDYRSEYFRLVKRVAELEAVGKERDSKIKDLQKELTWFRKRVTLIAKS